MKADDDEMWNGESIQAAVPRRHYPAPMDRTPAVYIMASGRNGTLYTGVTSDPPGRVYQHRTGMLAGFTKEHGCKRLVWFEVHEEMESAILREKRIKKWNREWKVRLIEESNPTWRDLAEDWGFDPLEDEGD